jgi:TRAP-type C4-dicarboxylate transport system permease small subunit
VTTKPLPKTAEPAGDAAHRVEEVVLAVLLSAMIVLASLQILLRSFLETGITWVGPLLRVLVLWIGLLGAVAAGREGRHITIDVLSRLLRGRMLAAVGALTSAFTAAVAAALAYHGARFVVSEYRFESVAFSGVPAWAFEVVIPFSFAVIALQYLWLAGVDVVAVFRGDKGDTPGAGSQ